ncbi:hypothetical protein VQH23_20245 [Pararoseomonas sp. SCSIO 73927]|uniref:hypothetical protein n=1 Tax=Pararoseomonas sp. SCSIO 73927 TaxID=3114537 RepID=UPI0030CFB868
MTLNDVLALLADPEKLMRRCYLHIHGGSGAAPANGQAALATFKVEFGHQTAMGFTTGLSGLLGLKKDRPFVKFIKQPGPAQNPVPADCFNAYYIPMVQTADVAAGSSHYTLPIAAGSLMITSKLSGCTVGIGSDANGAVLVSHVQPNANAAGGSAALSTAVQTGMHAMQGEFRRNSEYTGFAAVMGRCDGNRWRFYLQASVPGQTSNYSITDLRTI